MLDFSEEQPFSHALLPCRKTSCNAAFSLRVNFFRAVLKCYCTALKLDRKQKMIFVEMICDFVDMV